MQQNPLKFLLKQCFFFASLIAAECSSPKKYPLPMPTHLTGQKKNSNSSITISSTGAHALVFIGSNNTIHGGTTGQEAQTNTGINDLANSTPDKKNRIPSDGTAITITETDPGGIVVVGSNNTIYRPTQQKQQLKETDKTTEQELSKQKEERAGLKQQRKTRKEAADNKQQKLKKETSTTRKQRTKQRKEKEGEIKRVKEEASITCNHTNKSQLEIYRDETKNPAHIDEDNTVSQQNKSQKAIKAETTQPILEHTHKAKQAYNEVKDYLAPSNQAPADRKNIITTSKGAHQTANDPLENLKKVEDMQYLKKANKDAQVAPTTAKRRAENTRKVEELKQKFHKIKQNIKEELENLQRLTNTLKPISTEGKGKTKRSSICNAAEQKIKELTILEAELEKDNNALNEWLVGQDIELEDLPILALEEINKKLKDLKIKNLKRMMQHQLDKYNQNAKRLSKKYK